MCIVRQWRHVGYILASVRVTGVSRQRVCQPSVLLLLVVVVRGDVWWRQWCRWTVQQSAVTRRQRSEIVQRQVDTLSRLGSDQPRPVWPSTSRRHVGYGVVWDVASLTSGLDWCGGHVVRVLVATRVYVDWLCCTQSNTSSQTHSHLTLNAVM